MNNSKPFYQIHAFCDDIYNCKSGYDEILCLIRTIAYEHWYGTTGIVSTSEINPQRKHFMQCFTANRYYDYSDICLLFNHRKQPICPDGGQLLNCKYTGCSGMFKCPSSICIDIVMVCNGLLECPHGEDEIMCQNLTCPGMVKCKGETRCVPPWQICDGIQHCHTSADDEVACINCTTGCNCEYYHAECTLDGIKHNVGNQHFCKTVIVSGDTDSINFDFIQKAHNLLYLDISSMNIVTIELPETKILPTNMLFFNKK